MTTPKLNLPEVVANQSQPHLTINQALRQLDALVQLAVKDRGATVPPVSPAEGDAYILGPPPAGPWGFYAENQVVIFIGGNWFALTPNEGWIAWVENEAKYCSFDGTSWVELAAGGGGGGAGGGHTTVIDRDLSTPPVSPAAGDTYIIGPSPTGAWSGFSENDIVTFAAGIWQAETPTEGNMAWILDENKYVYFLTSWNDLVGEDASQPYFRKIYDTLGVCNDPSIWTSPEIGEISVVNIEGTLSGEFVGATPGVMRVYNGTDWATEIEPKEGDMFYSQSYNAYLYWYYVDMVTPEIYYLLLVDLTDISFPPPPKDFNGFFAGHPANGQVLWAYQPWNALEFYVGDMQVQAITPPTADFDIVVKSDGSVVGHIHVDTSGYGYGDDDVVGDEGPHFVGSGGIIVWENAATTDATVADIAVQGFEAEPALLRARGPAPKSKTEAIAQRGARSVEANRQREARTARIAAKREIRSKRN